MRKCFFMLLLATSVSAQSAWHGPPQRVAPLTQGAVPQSGLIADLGPGQTSTTQWTDSTGSGNDCIFSTAAPPAFVNGFLQILGGVSGGRGPFQTCTFPTTLASSARTVEMDVYLPTMVEAAQMNGCYKPQQNWVACSVYTFDWLLGSNSTQGIQIGFPNVNQSGDGLLPMSTYFPNIMTTDTTSKSSAAPVIGWNHLVFESGCASDGTYDRIFINGAEAAYAGGDTASQSCTVTNMNTGAWMLGLSIDDYGGTITARFEHMRAWSRILSSGDADQDSDEIAALWHAQRVEWMNHGVSLGYQNVYADGSTTPGVATITVVGDSQSRGTPGITAAQEWWAENQLTLPFGGYSQWNVFDQAVPAMTCDGIQSEIPVWGAELVNPAASHNVLLNFCGGTDIGATNAPAAQIFEFASYINTTARANGYSDVFEVTMLPALTVVEETNALLIANSTASLPQGAAPTYTLIDISGDPYYGGSGAAKDATRYNQSECCHLTVLSEATLGFYAGNVIASAFGNTASTPTVVSSAAGYQMLNSDNFVECSAASCQIQLPDCTGYGPGHARTIMVDAGGSAALTSAPANGSGSPVAINGSATLAGGTTTQYLVARTAQQTWSQGWTPAAGCSWNEASAPQVKRPVERLRSAGLRPR